MVVWTLILLPCHNVYHEVVVDVRLVMTPALLLPVGRGLFGSVPTRFIVLNMSTIESFEGVGAQRIF